MPNEDFERIDLVLATVREVWRQRPDKRFGQLLTDIDCDSKVPDLFFLNDFDLLKILDTQYREFKVLEAKAKEKKNV